MFDKFKKKKKLDLSDYSKEATFLLLLKDGNLSISVDWTEDFDVRQAGSLIGAIATGELAGVFLQQVIEYMKSTSKEAEIPEMQEIVKHRIASYQQTLEDENDNDNEEPIVQPVDAIRRQLTMYQQG